uniref:CD4-2 protein n=1 Tax=Iconisemion striatum TaxID=60296 RepID=A0A1A7XGH3_9TELE
MKKLIWFGVVLGALSAAGKVFIAEVGKKTILECGNSRTQTGLQWNRNSDQIYKVNVKTGQFNKGKNDIAERSRVILDRNLQICPEEKDAGRFTCIADKINYEHTLIVVSVSVNPSGEFLVGAEASLECRVSEPDKTSTVKWEKPDGSFENSPKIQLNPVKDSHGGSWRCQVTNGAEIFSKTLTITVKAATPKPSSPVPNHVTPNTPKPSEDDRSSRCNNCNHKPDSGGLMLLGLIWWIWVAVGVGSLVVIILIIVVIVMVRRIRRRKRKLLKMKNAKVAQRTKKYCQCERQTAAAKPRQGRRREKPSAHPLRPLLME